MENFVNKDSIVRKIWGNADTILLIFAGASAEFALNKAVDWLYFTGRLPKDPLGRLFATVAYARKIIFSEKASALKAIDKMNAIHASVESKRGKTIPEWAYRDVFFMLIDYSIRAYEILERSLKIEDKKEVFNAFSEVGKRMQLKELPVNFKDYESMRKTHLEQHLNYGNYSRDLYREYRKHLGWIRYNLLIETQIFITPEKVRRLLLLRKFSLLRPLIPGYKISRKLKLDFLLKSLLLPSSYKEEIKSLDHAPV